MVNIFSEILRWFTGGDTQYMSLLHCMNHDNLWIAITVVLDLLVSVGYGIIAFRWWRDQRHLQPSHAKSALNALRNIFIFCCLCGYFFVPLKIFWPAWRLFDIFMAFLVFYTYRYLFKMKGMKTVIEYMDNAESYRTDLQEKIELGKHLRRPIADILVKSEYIMAKLPKNASDEITSALEQIKRSVLDSNNLIDQLIIAPVEKRFEQSQKTQSISSKK